MLMNGLMCSLELNTMPKLPLVVSEEDIPVDGEEEETEEDVEEVEEVEEVEVVEVVEEEIGPSVPELINNGENHLYAKCRNFMFNSFRICFGIKNRTCHHAS